MPPHLSVVIPHVDSYPRYEACLASVLHKKPSGAEVVMAGDGASAATFAWLAGKPVRSVPLPERRGAGRARNAGARAASGEFLVFLDSDVELGPDFYGALDKRLEALEPKTILQGVYGVGIPYGDGPSQYKNLYYRFNFFRRNRASEIHSLSSHCFVMRRSDFEVLSGFDENMPGATVEDAEFGLRAVEKGFRIRLASDLEVTHHKRYTLGSLLATDFELCRGKLKVWLRRPLSMAASPRLFAVSGIDIGSMSAVVLSVALAPAALALLPLRPEAAAGLAAAVVALNVPFYLFIGRVAGAWTASQAVAISLLDYCAAFAGSCVGLAEFAAGRRY